MRHVEGCLPRAAIYSGLPRQPAGRRPLPMREPSDEPGGEDPAAVSVAQRKAAVAAQAAPRPRLVPAAATAPQLAGDGVRLFHGGSGRSLLLLRAKPGSMGGCRALVERGAPAPEHRRDAPVRSSPPATAAPASVPAPIVAMATASPAPPRPPNRALEHKQGRRPLGRAVRLANAAERAPADRDDARAPPSPDAARSRTPSGCRRRRQQVLTRSASLPRHRRRRPTRCGRGDLLQMMVDSAKARELYKTRAPLPAALNP